MATSRRTAPRRSWAPEPVALKGCRQFEVEDGCYQFVTEHHGQLSELQPYVPTVRLLALIHDQQMGPGKREWTGVGRVDDDLGVAWRRIRLENTHAAAIQVDESGIHLAGRHGRNPLRRDSSTPRGRAYNTIGRPTCIR